MIYWNIDADDYDYGTEEYIVSGWGYSEKGETIQIVLVDEQGKEIPGKFCRKLRLDVQEAFPDHQIPEENGFEFRLQVPKTDFSENVPMKILLLDGDQKTEAGTRSREEMRRVYEQQSMKYYIDEAAVNEKVFFVHGWYVDRLQENQIYLEDKKNRRLHTELKKLDREDIDHTRWIHTEEYKSGFHISVPLEEIRTAEVTLVFENSARTDRLPFDVKTMIFENSKRGKLWNSIKPENFRQNMDFIKENGVYAFREKLKKEINPRYSDYDSWIRLKELTRKQWKEQKQEADAFSWKPVISIIIPLYNTPVPYLKKMLDSVLDQTYGNWQLCLADGSSEEAPGKYIQRHYGKDSRVVYKKLESNGGISANTNEALKLVTGDYVLLADHDDVMTSNALYEIVKVLNRQPEIDIVYTDEDKISMDGKLYFDPNFKSDFNIDLLRSVNYICHIFAVRKTIVDQIGGFRSEYDGAQDYDFILRCQEKTEHIYHIPKVLYHWRAHPDSTAEDPESKRYAYDAGRHAIEAHYEREGIEAVVEDSRYYGIYRTRYGLRERAKISILILNKDHIEDLKKCVDSIREKSTYENYEIIIAENNSEKEETFAYYKELEQDSRIRVVTWKGEFNYSAINNFAAQYASGEYFLLLNNDIEVISPDWMEEMLGYCQRPEVGIVGAKLYYPDDTIQHAGVVIGMGGIAGHILCREDGKKPGYNGKLVTVQDMSAVTAACLMVKKSVYQEVGGLDETFKVAFNDIDFCMKVRATGKLVVFTPYAELYHYESKSRGLEDTPEKQLRFAGEIRHFQEKWSKELEKGDPYYNVNLSLTEGDCSLR